jgi:amidase
MSVRPPTLDDLASIAASYHLQPTTQDLEWYRELMFDLLASYAHLDQLVEPTLLVSYPRTPGYRPQPAENPLGAWYWRTEISGATAGLLAGKTIALKDNVCLAGVPMMNGTSVLEGYVPDIDATIVTRILDSGGTILGKAVCESLCFSGGSHTADSGPVRNPHNPEYSAGGSSSGSAALVAAGEVDMAIGGDQGGSIRGPSGWCGIFGLKPSYGLVPYTGIFPIELTLDHAGPMARSAADVARLLEVIAGPDGLDPRQSAGLQGQAYTRALSGDVRGLRLGVLAEGFGWDGVSEPDVDACVAEAAQAFVQLGAQVEQVSIPWHRDAVHVWKAITVEGMTTLMMAGNGMGTNWKGHYTTSLLDAFARGRTSRAQDLPPTVAHVMLLGQYMQNRYHGRYYAKAQNLSRSLKAAYDAALRSYDLLVMPTLPYKATRIPPADAGRDVYMQYTTGMGANMGPFDVTGHPAINVPCGQSGGLPIGMMLVGRIGDDATVLRAADAFERRD